MWISSPVRIAESWNFSGGGWSELENPEGSGIAMTACPACGKRYELDSPKCPFCGKKNTKLF